MRAAKEEEERRESDVSDGGRGRRRGRRRRRRKKEGAAVRVGERDSGFVIILFMWGYFSYSYFVIILGLYTQTLVFLNVIIRTNLFRVKLSILTKIET